MGGHPVKPVFGAPLYYGVSVLWRGASALVRLGVRFGFLKPVKLGPRVISVGNLQAGGTGKTPLVAAVADGFVARGQTVCILSRGYGGKWERTGGVIAPGGGPAHARDSGDEPALLHDLVPQAWLGVGADRAASYGRVVQAAGRAPDVVILDDGFQHWRLERDLDVVAVTSLSPWATLFREGRGALARAGLVVWTKGESWSGGRDGRLVRARFKPELLEHEKGGARVPGRPAYLPALWLVTGVADDGGVRTALEREGLRVSRHVSFRDHARYDEKMVRDLVEDAAKAGCRVAVTGKDWVKWREVLRSEDFSRVAVFEPRVEIVEGREAWEKTLWGG